jgi:glycosyltransferase involved in cell wall biosynthesis
MVTEFSLDENVVFAGQRHDVRKILPCCHFGLQTSRGEAFSLAILEYMSAGLLTIAPNHCGNAEAIEHGITGILYKAGDYREIARTIQLFLNEGDERKRIGLRAAQSVEISFNLRRTNRELIGLIDRELTT